MSDEEKKKLESEESDEPEVEMSFLEHLEELRWRILYALIGVAVGTIVAWIFIDPIIDHILLLPAQKAEINLQNLRPFGQLFLFFQVAFIVGAVLSVPNLFYQLWKFVSPALKSNEKKYVTAVVSFSTICFLSGIVFAYFIMLPLTLSFAGQFGSEQIENNFAIDEYFSIIISVMLAAGLVFELPMMSFFLSKLGLITPAFLKRFRRHSIVLILLAAAILTPGTDPVAQVLLAIPLVILYEISIFISKIFSKKSAST